MLKNYLITALRTLKRNKEYSMINIFGLAISIASCLLLFAVLRFETSFDTYHKNAKSIYRVVMSFPYPEGEIYTAGVPGPAPDAFRTDFPQLAKQAATFRAVDLPVMISESGKDIQHFKEDKGGIYAEPEFFEMLDFKWLHGSPQASLSEPNSAVLAKETAEKYFGSWQEAIGKSIKVDEKYVVKITGILESIPENSDFPIRVAISWKTKKQDDMDWGNVSSRRQLFIQLPEGMSEQSFTALLPAFHKKNIKDPDHTARFSVQPLSTLHYDDRFGNMNNRTVSKTTLVSFGIIALFLMITAAINFVNLAIAQVMKKSKEVGVRKVLGSLRSQLITQFLGETLVILLAATAISVILAMLALPVLQPILYLPKTFNIISSIESILFLTGVIVVLTIAAGAYPAFVMAGFKPVVALKSKINTSAVGGISLRKGLVVVQFVIAQVLVIVTIVVFLQINFFRTQPKGFTSESIVYFSLPKDTTITSRLEGFKSALLQQPGVANVSFSYTAPASRSNNTSSFRLEGSVKDEPFELNTKFADVDYFKTYQLQLVAGRLYQQSDTVNEYVVNEMFLKKMGIKSPEAALGKTIHVFQKKLPIVGVVRDFHNLSFHSEIAPIAISNWKTQYEIVSVKLESGKQKEALDNIGTIYTSFFPSSAFDYKFLDESMAISYQQEERLAKMTILFSGISIFISCLGLYGLISFLAVQRTKEVGIRKLLGASITHILFIFYREFIVMVLLAFAIAAPFAAWCMNNWLNTFVYHVPLSAWIFVVAVTGTLLVALITLSFQSVKAALVNPVDSLRVE